MAPLRIPSSGKIIGLGLFQLQPLATSRQPAYRAGGQCVDAVRITDEFAGKPVDRRAHLLTLVAG